MIPGILTTKRKPLLAFSCDFSSLPFTDSTGRHPISNSGVTSVGGRAVVGTGQASGLTVTGMPKDFSLGGEFDISVKVNAASVGIGTSDRSIFRVDQGDPLGTGSEVMELYRYRTGYLVLLGAGVDTSATYTLPLDTDVVLRVWRVGTTISLSADGVTKGSSTIVPPNLGRVLRIGGYNAGGYAIQWNGSIDDFSWTNN